MCYNMRHMTTIDKIINVHAGHRERLRKNIANNGIYNLDELHFLEYLLTFTITRADTNPIAHDLLKEFHSIEGIFEADVENLLNVKGVGIKTARFLQFMSVSAYMYNKSKANRKPKLETVGQIISYLNSIIPPSPNEQLVFVILNKNWTVKNYRVFKGVSHSFISLNSNEVAEYLVKFKANFCIIAHTHPNQSALPSIEDLKTFKSFQTALNAFSITLLENIILGEDESYSLKNQMFYNNSDYSIRIVNSKNYNYNNH